MKDKGKVLEVPECPDLVRQTWRIMRSAVGQMVSRWRTASHWSGPVEPTLSSQVMVHLLSCQQASLSQFYANFILFQSLEYLRVQIAKKHWTQHGV